MKVDQILIAPGPGEETFCSLKEHLFDSLGKQLFSAPNILWFSLNTSLFPTHSVYFRKAFIAATDQKQLKALFPRVQDNTTAPLYLMQSNDLLLCY